jgi:hypothetical protein
LSWTARTSPPAGQSERRPAIRRNRRPIPDDDDTRWRAAKQLRRERPGWLVIWVARAGRFHGYRLTGPRQGAPLTGQTTDDLAARIDQAEQAAHQQPRRNAKTQPGIPEDTGP